MEFQNLILKRQHRSKQANRKIKVCGVDTETRSDEGKVELLAAETGEYIHPTSFDDLMRFFFKKKFRGRSFVFFNLQYDVQAILKWMDVFPIMKFEKKPIRLNYWIATMGGLKPDDRTFSGELRRIMRGTNGRRAKGFPPGFLRKTSPWGMDTLSDEAINEGFIPTGSQDVDLFDAIHADAEGYPVYKRNAFDWQTEFDFQEHIAEYAEQENNPWLDLWELGETEYEGYHFRLIPWKYLAIRDIKNKHTVKFYDIFQFFNMSLEKAACRYLDASKLPDVDRANIKDFKTLDVINYCIQDAKLAGDLARFVLKLSDTHFPDSPKSLISKAGISEKHFRKTCQIPTINSLIDNNKEMIKMAWLTYKGGFFSAFQRGHFPELYVYDINSAYPGHMARLPDLSHGRFIKVKGRPPMGACMGWLACQVDVDGDLENSYISPLAMDYKNQRLYPSGTFTTWITLSEFEAIKNVYWTKPLIGCYWYPNGELEYPFKDEIERLYKWKSTEQDAALKYFIKIVLNSLYGKTIQKIPDRKTDLYTTGNLFNPFWAAYITAGTRLQLFDAMQKMSYDDLVLVATDSIMSKKRLDLPLNGSLGEWDLQTQGEGIVIGSGVYSIKDKEDQVITRNRGFKATKNVNFFDIGTSFATSIQIQVKAHITLARALIQGNYDKMNLIFDDVRDLNLNFDNRRFWGGKFEKADDILTKQISSLPLDLNLLTAYGGK